MPLGLQALGLVLMTQHVAANLQMPEASDAMFDSAEYEQYEALQASKLMNTSATIRKWIGKFDRGVEKYLARRFHDAASRAIVQSPVLCVGARLGGEVRGFQSLPNVDLAIGVDLEPGEKNERAPSMCPCAWRVSTARVQYRVGAWCDVMT